MHDRVSTWNAHPSGVGRSARWGSLIAFLALGCSPNMDGVGRALMRVVPSSPPELTRAFPAGIPSPEGLRATSGVLRSVPLKWDPLLVGDVRGYSIERSASRGGPFEHLAVVPDRLLTEWLDRGVDGSSLAAEDKAPIGSDFADGVTFYYRVRAYTAEGRLSEPSEIVAATTALPPAPPNNLRAYSHQPREVPLSWDASNDSTVSGYIVYRSPTSGGPFEQLHRISKSHETIHVDRGLGDLRVFYYGVSAVNAAGGEGPISEPVRAVTKPEPLPPFGLRVVEQSLGENVLEWAPNVESDIVEYRLLRFRAGSESAESVAVLPANRNRAKDTGALADETLSYSLIAVDLDRLESTPSSPLPVRSQGYHLIATVKRDGVHLAWYPRTEEGYRSAWIQRRGTFGYSEIGFGYDGTFVDRDVEEGHRYEYTVTLERPDASQGPTSSAVSIEIPKM